MNTKKRHSRMEESNHGYSMDRVATYKIKVPGRFKADWSDRAWEPMVMLERKDDGPPFTILTVTVDQAALQGLLRWLYSAGLPLVSVDFVETNE